MLVLTRMKREGIVITEGPVTGDPNQDRIVIRIIEFRGNKLKLGIEASDKYVIVREELLLQNDEEQNE